MKRTLMTTVLVGAVALLAAPTMFSPLGNADEIHPKPADEGVEDTYCTPSASAERAGAGNVIVAYPRARCKGRTASLTIETWMTRNGDKVDETRIVYHNRPAGTYAGPGTQARDPLGSQEYCAWVFVDWVISNQGADSTVAVSCWTF